MKKLSFNSETSLSEIMEKVKENFGQNVDLEKLMLKTSGQKIIAYIDERKTIGEIVSSIKK